MVLTCVFQFSRQLIPYDLVVPRTRQRIGDRAFSVAAPRAWNRLPTELKLLRSTDLFRRDLKTFCFILSTGTKIRSDSVMRRWSFSSGRNTSASVTVTVTVIRTISVDAVFTIYLLIMISFFHRMDGYTGTRMMSPLRECLQIIS